MTKAVEVFLISKPPKPGIYAGFKVIVTQDNTQ